MCALWLLDISGRVQQCRESKNKKNTKEGRSDIVVWRLDRKKKKIKPGGGGGGVWGWGGGGWGGGGRWKWGGSCGQKVYHYEPKKQIGRAHV